MWKRKPLKLIPWFAAIAIGWSLGFAYNVYGGGLINWLRLMYHNKVALAAEIDAPRRLLIAGGSGAHYTVNSELLEEELGFPVMNLALDGNLGLNALCPLIVEQVRPGDIVLFMPEYLLLLDDDGVGERTAEFGIAIGRPGFGGVSWRELAQDTWLLGVPSLRSLTKSSIDLVTKGHIDEYYSDPLTKHGEPTKTWDRQGEWWELRVGKPVTKHSIAQIAQFRKDIEAKGGHLILSMPIIYGSTEEKTVKNVQKTADELGQIAPLIYDPDTLNIWTDSSLFADTHYHLRPEGRIIRSQQILREIQPIIETLPQPSTP